MKRKTIFTLFWIYSMIILVLQVSYIFALNVNSKLSDPNILLLKIQEKTESIKSSLLEGRKILLKAVEAAGGLENFKKIKNFNIKTQNVLTLSQNELQLTVTETAMPPNRTKQVFEMPAGKRIQVLNGDTGWKQIGVTISDLSGTEKREMKRGLFRDAIHLFQMSESEDLKIEYFGDETIAGKTLHVLRISDKSGDFFNIYIDVETFLIAKKTYHGSSEVGLATLEEIYSDYREVDGVKLPFHTVVRANAKKFIDAIIIDVKLNIQIDEEFFMRN